MGNPQHALGTVFGVWVIPTHAERVVRAAQNAEREEMEKLVQSGRHMGDTTSAEVELKLVGMRQLVDSMVPEGGVEPPRESPLARF